MPHGKDKTSTTMKSFWDAKAEENAMYYVSSYREYGQEEPEEFWKWGHVLAERYLDQAGLELTGDETALDLGCGIGRFTAVFAERCREVHGVDISEAMITRAREHLAEQDNVTFHVGSGRDLAMLEDACIDFAWSYIMFQHIPDPGITLGYLREVGRVLRPDGRALFQVNNAPRPGLRARLRLGTRLRRGLATLGVRRSSPAAGPSGLDNPAWVGSRLTLEEMRGACAAGGMTIEWMQGEGTQYLWVRARKESSPIGTANR